MILISDSIMEVTQMKTNIILVILAILVILGFVLPAPINGVTLILDLLLILYLVIDIFVSVKKRKDNEK